MENYNNALKNIALLLFLFGTHAALLLSLVCQLLDAYPSTMFSFICTKESNNLIFPKNEKLDNVKPFNVWSKLLEGYSFKGNPHEPMEYFLKGVRGNFREAIDAVVAEIDELNVHWVVLWTSDPQSIFLLTEADVIRQHARINGPQDNALDFFKDFSGIRVADLPDALIFGSSDASVPALLDKTGPALSRVTAIAANSYEDLDITVVNMLESRFNMFLNIGPFNLVSVSPIDDKHGCLDWLHKHEPASVVYISFGSVITPPPHEIAALAEALEECDLPYRWSFRENPENQLPPGFLERTRSKGKIVPWAPQLKILENPAAGVFVTHDPVFEVIIVCFDLRIPQFRQRPKTLALRLLFSRLEPPSSPRHAHFPDFELSGGRYHDDDRAVL
ncbi:hypothetical protein REPUB_Repub18cG0044100 [Reevesia pubescens]